MINGNKSGPDFAKLHDATTNNLSKHDQICHAILDQTYIATSMTSVAFHLYSFAICDLFLNQIIKKILNNHIGIATAFGLNQESLV